MRRASDFGSLGWNCAHHLGPEQARGAQLRHLHEEVHADRPEERQARREGVDVQADLAAAADVLDAVGQGVGELEVGGRPGLLHVVAGNADRVELGHVLRRVGEDVRDDPHRGRGREDVGVADHELLEDVVLDGPAQLLGRHALLLGGEDVERQHRQDGAVHGHRHAHLVERDALEQDLHVQDRIDRDPGHADIAHDARMVAVVAAMGGEVEGDRQALSARPRGCAGRRRCCPRPWRSRHTAGSSRAGSCTWWDRGRAGTAAGPARCRGNPARPCRRRCRAAGRRCLRASPRPVLRCWPLGREGGARLRVAAAGRAQRQVGEARDLAHAASPASTASVALQRRQDIGAGMDELVDAGRLPSRALRLVRPAHQIDPGGMGMLERASRRLGRGRIVGVTGADRGLPGAAGPKGVAEILDRRQRLATDVAIPPAANRLRAKVARAANSSWRPRVHRKTRGRSPVRARIASLRSRRRSKPSARRKRRDRLRSAAAPVARHGQPGPWSVRRLAQVGELRDAGDRLAPGGDIRLQAAAGSPPPAPAASPARSAASMPPRRSTSWTSDHALMASSSVRRSTNQLPPAGSMTRPSCALLEQDELGVARDAPGQRRGQAQRMVERQHRDAARHRRPRPRMPPPCRAGCSPADRSA